MPPKALAEAITPRPSVFDPSVRETVYDIGRSTISIQYSSLRRIT